MKDLLLILLLLSASFNSIAEDFIIENYLGIHCLKHIVTKDETFYEVAHKFFVRPSTLAIVNNIDNAESLLTGRELFIPLTETNFYKTKGLEGSKYLFKPVYYQIEEESMLSQVAESFYVRIEDLAEWNKGALPLKKRDRLIVGWVKFVKSVNSANAPKFVLKEKMVYGNSLERQEAREELLKSRVTAKDVNFPDYSIPQKAVPVTNDVKTVPKVKEVAVAKSKLKKKVVAQTKNNKVSKVEKLKKELVENPNNRIKQKKLVGKKDIKKTTRITKSESDYLKKKEPKLKVKRRGFLNNMKSLTRNSYSRKKDQLRVSKSKPEVVMPLVKKESVKKQPVQQEGSKLKKVEPIVNNEVIDKSYTVTPKNSAGPEKASDPLYVQNKLQKLTLLKSMKGRASFFYSGTAGAKFYVFTNLANKGGIIKLTNLNNGKYILAQVIGPLPEADRKKGIIIKLSDNSRRLLNVQKKSFATKVNY